MNSVKKLIMLQVPTSICNFRCHYCYLAQRAVSFQGLQAEMKYNPEQVRKALSYKRMGGPCFINVCADGETLLTKDIDLYLKPLVQEGHYLEIVSNMTVTPMIERILSWEPELLSHVEFKCSFHYLELKKHNLLETYANNVKKAWTTGASATIELMPSDELIPYIDEVKAFSLKYFGAYPQLTIGRDDTTIEIKKLTKLSENEYRKTWEGFNSDFWELKQKYFGVKQKQFCYAGCWSITVNLSNGIASRCYYEKIGNIFDDPDKPIPETPIGQCPIAHCYNCHAFLTFGLIPHSTNVGYGDIRNRVRADGTEWLQPELKNFFNTKLWANNNEWQKSAKRQYIRSINRKRGNTLSMKLRGRLSRYKFYQKLHEWKVKLK